MRKSLLDALDMVFIPKQIAKQIVLAVALESSMVCCVLCAYGLYHNNFYYDIVYLLTTSHTYNNILYNTALAKYIST